MPSARPALLLSLLIVGCASPGPPRPPSLHLPDRVTNLHADRIGDTVELSFDTPTRTSDNLPLNAPVTALLCRAVDDGPCQPTATHPSAQAISGAVIWHDLLPPDLLSAPARKLTYRVQVSNPARRSAGWSDPALTASGPAPPAVRDFTATGSRSGILLRWTPEPPAAGSRVAEVLIERTKTTQTPASTPQKKPLIRPILPAKARQNTSSRPRTEARILHADQPLTTDSGGLIDTSAQPDTPYQYTAFRRRRLTLNGAPIDLRSTPTPPINISLQDIYPPPIPASVVAASDHNAVDLNWIPVSDPDLAGYNVYRMNILSPNAAVKLTPTPTPLPAFHDPTAPSNTHLRYRITSVDHHGNESPQSDPADIQTGP